LKKGVDKSGKKWYTIKAVSERHTSKLKAIASAEQSQAAEKSFEKTFENHLTNRA